MTTPPVDGEPTPVEDPTLDPGAPSRVTNGAVGQPLGPEAIRASLRDPGNRDMVLDILRYEMRRDPDFFRQMMTRDRRLRVDISKAI